MPGFTAINARMVEAQRPMLENLPVTNEGNGPRTKASTQRSLSHKQHSRVGESTEAMDGNVPGDHTNNRISGRGKKRLGQFKDQPATKRSKSGNVDVSMHIAKSGVQTTDKVDPKERISFKSGAPSSTDAAGISLSSKLKLESLRYNNMRSPGDTDKLVGRLRPISVYAPQNSMSTVSPWPSDCHFQMFCPAPKLYCLRIPASQSVDVARRTD